MSFTKVIVTGTYLRPDGATPCTGTVEFTPSSVMQDSSTNEIIEPARAFIDLDAQGSISIALVATDDATTSPTGVTYRVIERITGAPLRVYSIVVHAAAAPSVDLADLAPVTNTAVNEYALVSTVTTLDLRVTALEAGVNGGTP